MNKQKIRSIMLLLMATVIWGSAFIVQSVGNSIGPFTFQAVRCFLAVAFLVPVVFVMDQAYGRSYAAEWCSKGLWKAGLWCGLALFVAVVGLYLLSAAGVSEINRGDLMVMGCALAFAVQITIVDRCAAELTGSILVFSAVLISQIPSKKQHR